MHHLNMDTPEEQPTQFWLTMHVFSCFPIVYLVKTLGFLFYILFLKDKLDFHSEATQLKHKKKATLMYLAFRFVMVYFGLAIKFNFDTGNGNFLRLISRCSFLLLLSYEFQIGCLNDHQLQNFKMLKVKFFVININFSYPF